jgi:uncharacterized membrane protein
MRVFRESGVSLFLIPTSGRLSEMKFCKLCSKIHGDLNVCSFCTVILIKLLLTILVLGRLCSLVFRISGYSSIGPGIYFLCYQIF